MGSENPHSAFRIPKLHWLLWAIIAVGVALRLVIFFQNRNLIIDEANIVRNLADRGFAGLTHPLKYEQYAPPVFLWIEKAVSIIAGYGEKAMRFYSLVCGAGVLLVFYKVSPSPDAACGADAAARPAFPFTHLHRILGLRKTIHPRCARCAAVGMVRAALGHPHDAPTVVCDLLDACRQHRDMVVDAFGIYPRRHRRILRLDCAARKAEP